MPTLECLNSNYKIFLMILWMCQAQEQFFFLLVLKRFFGNKQWSRSDDFFEVLRHIICRIFAERTYLTVLSHFQALEFCRLIFEVRQHSEDVLNQALRNTGLFVVSCNAYVVME